VVRCTGRRKIKRVRSTSFTTGCSRKRLRALAVIDEGGESLAIEVDLRSPASG